eukprot:GFKZ01003666.1.p1 GENE.GFKZ01003666.1~~GFKZ01003666.1.p1  ORF type:complete len:116 (+),score=5.32 GFKZ01003666.1:372-719(+)
MVDLLPSAVPSLFRFLIMVYARRMPLLILLAWSAQGMPYQDVMQQGHQASMLMFSLVVHPPGRAIVENTSLTFHRWYADDCTFLGKHADIHTVDILRSHCPDYGFILSPKETRVF